jgi:MmyB-like transcription regulator ligand binding domain
VGCGTPRSGSGTASGRPPERIVDALLDQSEEFSRLWAAHEIGSHRYEERRRIQHPELGILELHCQVLS